MQTSGSCWMPGENCPESEATEHDSCTAAAAKVPETAAKSCVILTYLPTTRARFEGHFSSTARAPSACQREQETSCQISLRQHRSCVSFSDFDAGIYTCWDISVLRFTLYNPHTLELALRDISVKGLCMCLRKTCIFFKYL